VLLHLTLAKVQHAHTAVQLLTPCDHHREHACVGYCSHGITVAACETHMQTSTLISDSSVSWVACSWAADCVGLAADDKQQGLQPNGILHSPHERVTRQRKSRIFIVIGRPWKLHAAKVACLPRRSAASRTGLSLPHHHL